MTNLPRAVTLAGVLSLAAFAVSGCAIVRGVPQDAAGGVRQLRLAAEQGQAPLGGTGEKGVRGSCEKQGAQGEGGGVVGEGRTDQGMDPEGCKGGTGPGSPRGIPQKPVEAGGQEDSADPAAFQQAEQGLRVGGLGPAGRRVVCARSGGKGPPNRVLPLETSQAHTQGPAAHLGNAREAVIPSTGNGGKGGASRFP